MVHCFIFAVQAFFDCPGDEAVEDAKDEAYQGNKDQLTSEENPANGSKGEGAHLPEPNDGGNYTKNQEEQTSGDDNPIPEDESAQPFLAKLFPVGDVARGPIKPFLKHRQISPADA